MSQSQSGGWGTLSNGAAVAQIAGVDAFGLIKMIVERAEKVRRNWYECNQLAEKVETIGSLLPQVSTELRDIAGVVKKLEATLRDAVVLVSYCRQRGYIRRFFRSGTIAEQFRRIKEEIDFHISVFNLVINIDTTRRFGSLVAPQSTNLQNLPRSSSIRSERASRPDGDDDYSSEHRPRARTQPVIAVHREETAASRVSSRKDDIGHLLIPNTQQGLIIGTGFSLFRLSLLQRATNNFSHECKIGEGGFGRVYKGLLHGLPVAIKRCFVELNPERQCDFENEIKFIPKLQHRNIVKLQGYCTDEKERILVYEYMQNKSLDKFIFGAITGWSLKWDRLFGIIGGIAQGVVYLHLHSGLNIIHRDLKPSNILLDSDMNPKISDFGTAKFCPPDESKKSDVFAGTHGYMAPEYSTKGIFSGKTDVFSFGSLLLEILSGKRNSTCYSIRGQKSLSLHEYAWKLVFEEKTPEKLIRASLHLSGDAARLMSQIVGCLHVALLCVQEDPSDRPSMWDVVLMLNGDVAAFAGLPNPKQPVHLYGGQHQRRGRRTIAEFLVSADDGYKRTVHGRPEIGA